jgi:tetraacyldisaccharide 4'-kinase
VTLVDPRGSARNFGDEPLLIARRLEVPVIVGEARQAAGQFAEQKYGPQLHLLDDGFQHRQLARDFDIVLLTPEDAHDSLLPAGRLREPLSSLDRADAIVLTGNMSTDSLPIQQQLVWRVRRGIVLPPISEPCFAFCGIAKPKIFFDQLLSAGSSLSGMKSFRDHHAYSVEDVEMLLTLRRQSGATAFITTEKDAVNLGPHLPALDPLHIVPVRMELENANAAIDALLARVGKRKDRPS